MLRNTTIRRTLAALLMGLGILILLLATQTWAGVLLVVLGIAVELIAITFDRK